MTNLAGRPDAAEVIVFELERCGIAAVDDPSQAKHPEVKAAVIGHLNGFTFRRNWYYYSTYGLVPLEIAKALYETKVGRTDIRVAGHCGRVAPEAPWIDYFTKAGKPIHDIKGKAEWDRVAARHEFLKEKGKSMVWSDDPGRDGLAFISNYHIDSELGLYLFARAIERIRPSDVVIPLSEAS